MASPLTLVIHGHFYQPPRENPWTEEVTREPSAAPYHDWNSRITAECYRPNTSARIVDERGRLVSLVDNYERISFDFGPTLLSWLHRHDPATYERMVAADRAGHGGMAQAFGHLILPLCNERDLRTQIRWGLADFRHRFGREATGMWLPEAAVNDEVLAALVDEGVGFTVLAPRQAVRVRDVSRDDDEWVDVSDGSIDTTRAYRWCHPSGDGRGLDIVFYDGHLSHDVAFGLGSMSSQGLIDRVIGTAPRGGLVTIAADGETFGHHHRYGDRLLAYALAVEAPNRDVEVSSVAAFLAADPLRHEVQIRESSWSCIHGVARWREDCGCSTGGEPGWNQRWRTPLRGALDLLRDHAAAVFDRRGRAVFADDPWTVRDAYVNVLLGVTSRDEFARQFVSGDPVDAFTLLESQRYAMAMYTSCGWFFNDLAGLETVQVLRYAARVMDLLAEIGENTAQLRILEHLGKAESNREEEGNGRQVWSAHVEPARVDSSRVVAHLALAELLEGSPPPDRLANHDIEVIGHEHAERGAVAVSSGHVVLTHRRTGRRFDRVYAAVRLGGLEVLGANRPADARRDDVTIAILREAFAKGAHLATLIRLVSDGFGPNEFGLSSALPDGADQILQSTADAVAERFAATIDRLFDDHRLTLEALTAMGAPLPAVLQAPSELALARRFEAAVAAAAESGSVDPRRYTEAVEIARSARANGWKIGTPAALTIIERMLLSVARRAVTERSADAIVAALAMVALTRDLDLHPNWEPAQQVLYHSLLGDTDPRLAELGDAFGLAVERLGQL